MGSVSTRPKASTDPGFLRRAPDPVFLIDGARRVVEVNAKAIELLNHSKEDLLGKSLLEIVVESSRPELRKIFEDLGRTGEGSAELPLLKRDGGTVLVELHASRLDRPEELYLAIFRDVSARKQMEMEIRRRNKELFVIHSIASVVNRSLDLDEILESGLKEVLTLLDIEAGYIVLLNEKTGELELAAHRGLSPDFIREYSRMPLRVGEGITGQVFITGEPVHSPDASQDARVTRAVVKRDRLGSSLNVPIKSKERILGVLMVVGTGIREFSSWDIEILTTIGNEIGVSLENSRLYRDVVELLHFSSELNRRLDTEGLLRFLAEKARELVPCHAAVAALVDTGGVSGYVARDKACSPFRRGLGLALLPDEESTGSKLSVPLMDGNGGRIGAVELHGRKALDRFTEKDCDLVSSLVAQASIAIEKSRLFKEREREAEFTANIVENMASGLIVLEASGVVQKVNRRAAEMIGLTEKEICSRYVRDWLPDFEALFQTGQFPLSLETELRTHGDEARAVRLIASRQINEDQPASGVILIIQDLEQIRLLERKERERRRLATIGEVAAGVAHEIRNPLFGISSVAQILRIEEGTRPEHRPLLDAMMSEIDRMNRMVEDLLFYGRPSPLIFNEVVLEEIWRSILVLHEGEIQKRRITIGFDFQSDIAGIWADGSKLRQVFLNLLKNAFEATPPGGTIRIEARSASSSSGQEGVRVKVRDTGRGIAPEKIGKVFELFYSEKRGGSGLGLPICKKIIEDHGGSIGVDSRPGDTTFHVWIPRRSSCPAHWTADHERRDD